MKKSVVVRHAIALPAPEISMCKFLWVFVLSSSSVSSVYRNAGYSILHFFKLSSRLNVINQIKQLTARVEVASKLRLINEEILSLPHLGIRPIKLEPGHG